MSARHSSERAIWFMVSNVTNAGVTFLTMILLARALTPQQYGSLAIYLTFSGIATSVLSFSLDGSVSVSYFKRTTEELRIHVSSCIVMIGVFLLALCATVVFISKVFGISLYLEPLWILIGLICGAAQAIINIKLALWMVKGEAIHYALFQVSQTFIIACVTLAFVYYSEMGWESRAWAQILITLIFGFIVIWMMLRDGETGKKISINEMRRGAKFGVPLIPHVCGAILFTSADRLLVNSLLGSAATGLYQLAAQIGSIVMVGTDAINKAFAPWLYRHLEHTTDQIKRKIVVLTYCYFGFALALSAIFFMVPLNFALMFGGKEYLNAGALVPIFILGQCIGGMYFMVVNYIFYVGNTRYLSVATLTSGIVGIMSAYVLIGHFGLIGAAIAFPISRLFHFLTTWLISSRLYPMPWLLKTKP